MAVRAPLADRAPAESHSGHGRPVSEWLLPRGTTVEVNSDAYVQPEPLVRAQTAEIYNRIVDAATGQPVLSVDEIREAERLTDTTTAHESAIAGGPVFAP